MVKESGGSGRGGSPYSERNFIKTYGLGSEQSNSAIAAVSRNSRDAYYNSEAAYKNLRYEKRLFVETGGREGRNVSQKEIDSARRLHREILAANAAVEMYQEYRVYRRASVTESLEQAREAYRNMMRISD